MVFEREKMEVGFTVDWCGFTVANDIAQALWGDLWRAGDDEWEDTPPLHGYQFAKTSKMGVRMMWHGTREEMRSHFQFSGSALRAYQAQGMDWHWVMVTAANRGALFSRVDLAIDVKDGGLHPVFLCEPNLRPYKGKGRTPVFTTLTASDKSWTIYVGRRSSDKFLRIYDKAKEQGDYDSDYVRIELECKGEIARAVGWQISNAGRTEAMDLARTLIRGQADFNLENWDAALSSESVALALPKARERNTLGWLIDVCAPALAKEIDKNPSVDVLEGFWNALADELRKRGHHVK